MAANSDLTPGTWVTFTSDSRLRLVKEGHREQLGIQEGLLIGEQQQAVIVQKITPDSYTIIFPDTQMFGWVYSYEIVADLAKPKLQLSFVKQ